MMHGKRQEKLDRNGKISIEDQILLPDKFSQRQMWSFLITKLLFINLVWTLAIYVTLYIILIYSEVLIEPSFLFLLVSGLIMLYGGIIGTIGSSPSLTNVVNILKLGGKKQMDKEKIRIAASSSIFYFSVGVFMLLISPITGYLFLFLISIV